MFKIMKDWLITKDVSTLKKLSSKCLFYGFAAFIFSDALSIISGYLYHISNVFYAFQIFYLFGLYFSLRWFIMASGKGAKMKAAFYSFLNLAGAVFFAITLFVISGCGTYEKPRERLADSSLIPIAYSKNYEMRVAGAQKFTDFDLRKYQKIRNQLIREGLRKSDEFLVPRKISREELLLVHTPEYLTKLRSSKYVSRALEASPLAILPSSLMQPMVLNSFMYISEGTVLCARRALERGIAINLGGGYAHASSDKGEGFGLIADVPIAIRALEKDGLIKRAMIVDLDVHKGHGDILVFKDDRSVYIFDMYEMGIYPTGSFDLRADRDIPLSFETKEEGYMHLLQTHLPKSIEKAKPDIIFYVAGSDPYYKDKLGSIQMSFKGLVERDLFVLDEARKRNIPIIMVLSGGYSEDSWRIHFETIKEIILKNEKR